MQETSRIRRALCTTLAIAVAALGAPFDALAQATPACFDKPAASKPGCTVIGPERQCQRPFAPYYERCEGEPERMLDTEAVIQAGGEEIGQRHWIQLGQPDKPPAPTPGGGAALALGLGLGAVALGVAVAGGAGGDSGGGGESTPSSFTGSWNCGSQTQCAIVMGGSSGCRNFSSMSDCQRAFTNTTFGRSCRPGSC